MTVKEIREAVQASRTDRPFVLHLADGRHVQVPHVDYIFFPPVGSNIVIWTRQGTMRLIEASLVTELEVTPHAPRPKAGK